MDYVNYKYSIISNEIIDAIPIIINSISNDSENNVKSTKLGGTKFNVCSTCTLTKENGDMGHLGKTPLKNIMIIRPAFIKLIINFLNTIKICNNCKMIRNNIDISNVLNKYNYKYSPQLRREIQLLIKTNKQGNLRCNNPNCGKTIGSYKYNYSKSQFFIRKTETDDRDKKKKSIDEPISNTQIYNLLKGIPDIIYNCLTANTSESILTPYEVFFKNNIPIMVLPARPPNYYDNKESHVMTTKLGQLVGSIIKFNTEDIIQKIYNDIDHVKPKSPYKKGNLLVTLNIQVSGNKKESIPRSNILARRSDNTGRCVAGPSMEKIGYINIPSLMAKTLTTSIYYNRFTENKIKNLILNNTEKVKYILLYNYNQLKPTTLLKIKPDTKINNLMKMKYGDRIEVELSDYDIILFSRQPSLHKFNIQAALCKIWNNNTVGIPTPIANSMNLDFDGDEVNEYKTQSPGNIEALFTMLSVNLVKNNYNLSPIFGLIQDQIIGLHLLYKKEEYDINEVIYILGEYSYFIRDINKLKYSGSELLSLIFPDNISYEGVFDNGELIINNISSRFVVSQSYYSLSNLMSHYKNNVFAVQIIDTLLYIVRNFISLYGYSISLLDIIPDIKFINYIYNYIEDCCKVIQYVMGKYYNSISNNHDILLTYDELENIRINNCTNIINNVQKKIIELFKDNPLNAIVAAKNSEYKITLDELVTVLGCTGQQGIDSNDIPKPGIMGRVFNSILPSSLDIESLGFIKSSTLKGLTFKELGFHTKYNSIKKILRITCETSSAGSTGRKLVKFMEGVKIDHYGRAVLHNTVVWQNANYLKMLGSDIVRVNILEPDDNMENYNIIKKLYDDNKKYLLSDNFTRINKEFLFPINIKLEIQSYKSKIINDLSAKDLSNKIEKFINYIHLNIYFYLIDLTWFKYILYTYLDKFTIKRFKNIYSAELIDYILDKIKLKLYNSLSPGYTIGLEYAHNIQEKFTQQSLSSFHTTKKSGTAATQLGFNDFKDTVELSRKNKPDIVTAYSTNRNKLEIIKINVEYLSIKFFNPDISIIEENTKNSGLVISIKINKFYVNKKLTLMQYYQMFLDFLDNCIIINSYWSKMKLYKDIIDIIIGITIVAPYNINKIYFMQGISSAVYKGKMANTNIDIENIKMYDDNMVQVDGYRLRFYIENVYDLSNFDTRDVYLELGPWFAYDAFGIQFAEYSICNRLINSTKEKSMEICYKILSKLMCLSTDMYNIKRLRDGKNSILKNAIHGVSDSIQNSAFNNIIDTGTDIYSQIFENSLLNIGHGYYESYLNLNKYDSISLIKKEILEKNIESEIIENF
ncbi:putative RNA polymerase largest subunit [Alphaentomopoxvirus acuprea]|uniref:DNA-directed RNA polymerase 147 kDa polypeptide n=1 Tax=Alphaentomopoxvirus acuprea TaxID=62099 RepID=W6JL64_9POXV|nr:putative RNA polymerase largest subunit [Anomala cuprea entomopoxvirus]BAO49590.1 putative RNA polymerase largest subunit [Anomala cuprea entomopoxvirus]